MQAPTAVGSGDWLGGKIMAHYKINPEPLTVSELDTAKSEQESQLP
jgi:hypothetical protein